MTTQAFTIGIMQDHATPTRRRTSARAERSSATAAGRGAQIICLKELFNAPYFCKSQQSDRFDLAEPIPGPTTDRAAGARAGAGGRARSCRSSSARPPGVYRNSAAVIDADGALLGVYRKMHIPDDPLFYEKYYFTPGDGAAGGQRRAGRRVARLQGLEDALRDDRRADLLGPVVSRRRRASRACWARRSSSIRPRSAGIPSRRTSGAARRSTPGGPRSARTRSPTASTSRRPTASATRTSRAPSGITFFGHSFIADPFGRYLAEAGEERSRS